jgi:putative PEP-CTERM system histidine kinase
MTFNIFIAVSILVNLVLWYLIRVKRYGAYLTYPLLGLALIFPLNSLLGSFLQTTWGLFPEELNLRLFYSTSIASTLLLKEFVKRFLHEDEVKLPVKIFHFRLPVTLIAGVFGVAAIVLSLVLPFFNRFVFNGEGVLELNSIGECIISVQLIIALYTLLILENTYRFAQAFQRRIARLCLLALAVMIIFQLLFTCHLLLYRIASLKMLQLAAVVYGTSLPVLLIGLLRYRLGPERISVPRNAVFSTISLLLSGAAFLGIGLTVMVFDKFNIDFNYFERTLLIFSLSFFAVLIIGSGNMRKRIAQFINRYFYSHKYDYREQFFNLHRSFMTGENIETSLTEIVETMKYAVNADDAFIFLTKETDGHFYMHENKESATDPGCLIRADSTLVKQLRRSHEPVPRDEPAASDVHRGHMVDSGIKADIFFPITNQQRLLGILALKLRPKTKIDEEDRTLVEAFANSIGDVLFKNKVLTERVERKQFESFSHLSTFLVHDIKNQAATLSLVVSNAEKNIGNPEFQKSLLSSLKSCSGNLQRLIEKLKSPPKSDSLTLKRVDVNSVIDRVVENAGFATVPGVAFAFKRGQCPEVQIDEESLFYVVKNLVVNALEAMEFQGGLTVVTGPVWPAPPELSRIVDPRRDFIGTFKVCIIVSDSGKGMTREFIDEKLFHPFTTTKDKGIGIGLYQCKTLVEKMNGKLLCRSEKGRGTDFCILL